MTRYLTGDKERVLWQDTRGVASLDLREMVREMESTVRMSSRCQKRVYHVSLSFAEEDAPTRAQKEDACDTLLRGLGLEEHQVFILAHGTGRIRTCT